MKRVWIYLKLSCLAIAAFLAAEIRADAVSSEDARHAARGWSMENASTFGGRGNVVDVTEETDPADGSKLWYTVRLEEGTAIVSPDTGIEPVIALLPDSDGVIPADSPLRTLLTRDLRRRKALLNRTAKTQNATSGASGPALSVKWSRLIGLGKGTKFLNASGNPATIVKWLDGWNRKNTAAGGQTLRFWNQENSANYFSNARVFNSCTPNHDPCGCVATAGSSVLHYYRIASGSKVTRTCSVNGVSRSLTTTGGPYDWGLIDSVSLTYGSPVTLSVQAYSNLLGRVASDVGIGCNMSYAAAASGSSSYRLGKSFREAFNFQNAQLVTTDASNWGPNDGTTIAVDYYPQLIYNQIRAGAPVVMGIDCHEVVATGYGIDSDGQNYTFVFLGWGGYNDAWYALPVIDSKSTVDGGDYESTFIDEIITEIAPSDNKYVPLVGRVTDEDGTGVPNESILLSDGTRVTTDANGYWGVRVAPASGYVIAESKNVRRTYTVGSAAQSTTTAAKAAATLASALPAEINIVLTDETESRPDLAVVANDSTWPAAIYLSKSGETSASTTFGTGESVCYSYAVGNNGSAATTRTFGTRVSILASGGSVMYTFVHTNAAVVAAGAKAFAYTQTRWNAFALLPAGSYVFKVEADCHGEVPESNENNNVASVSFTVTSSGSGVSIPEALDNDDLTFTVGGDGGAWYAQTATTYDGEDAMRSGALGNNATNWIATTVSGPGTLSFYWYVSSEARYDFLEFLVDGAVIKSISGQTNSWTHVEQEITGAGTHVIRWRYRKDVSLGYGDDAGYLDRVVWTPATSTCTVTYSPGSYGVGSQQTAVKIVGTGLTLKGAIFTRSGYVQTGWSTTDGGAQKYALYATYSTNASVTLYPVWTREVAVGTALDNTVLTFTRGGSVNWFGQAELSHDGVDALRSGMITHGQISYLQTSVTGPGTISFWWYVSSESASWDYLFFSIDGVATNRIGGTTGSWTQRTYNLPSGTHTLRWTYRKDGSVSRGLDAGFLDQVVWTPTGVGSVAEIVGSSGAPSYLLSLRSGGPLFVVDESWFTSSGIDTSGGVTASLMNGVGANGLPRYLSFIFGLEPESAVPAEEQLKTTISFDAEGNLVVSCEPKRESSLVTYTTLGKSSLGDSAWREVTDANRATMKFFKVRVELK